MGVVTHICNCVGVRLRRARDCQSPSRVYPPGKAINSSAVWVAQGGWSISKSRNRLAKNANAQITQCSLGTRPGGEGGGIIL